MLPLEIAVYFFTSAITLLLSYFNISTRSLQQLVVAILLVLLISLSRSTNLKFKKGKLSLFQFFVLLLSSFFVQLLVVTTGGFYSPFLILIHLYTIGTSFLLDLQSSISFLIFSLLLLSTDIFVNANMKSLFKDDPWSVVLYFISFIVIIPLAQILTRNYHLKEAVSNMLSEYIKIEERREESILTGLSEVIIVTDRNLKVLSVNNAAERALGSSDSELVQKQFLEAVPLKDKKGVLATPDKLSIEQALRDKATRIVDELYFSPAGKGKPKRVDLQVRPIFDLEGKINQIVFVLSDPEAKYMKKAKHSDLEQTQIKREAMIDDLNKYLKENNMPKLQLKSQLITHIGDDLITALEMEDHNIDATDTLIDVAFFCRKIVLAKQEFAQTLGVSLQFYLPKEEASEYALLSLQESSTMPKNTLPTSDFAALVDIKWLDVCLQKFLEVAIFLSSGNNNAKVQMSTHKIAPNKVQVKISLSYSKLTEKQETELFLPYYGSLGNSTNLKYSSGLEGYIGEKVADSLGIIPKVDSEGYPAYTVLLLELSRST